ncbi:response regulator transcription factor [Virgibacillus proomii]|jgi:two-component system, OmpR family, response regulator RegX3|uniref:response regulator transcription factor n=1 Tax=Virgibacillus proomii TaxID=84407 RepID=UPI000985917C|nr:response regulator transcription factor [Virgibacillus proomii]
MKKILLVEDDLSLIEGLKFFLLKQGFNVAVARTVKEANDYFHRFEFHLILLDLMLPDGSGFDLCKTVRQTSEVPIIFLTASDEEANVVMGLDIGGDDYMTKPLKLNELISRMNATWRRSGYVNEQSAELNSNGIIVRLLEGRALKNGVDLDLTAVEYRLLCLFMQHPNYVLSKEQIMQKLWDNRESFIDDNTLAVYISRLRDKIEDDPRKPSFLTTIRGLGYKWSTKQGDLS